MRKGYLTWRLCYTERVEYDVLVSLETEKHNTCTHKHTYILLLYQSVSLLTYNPKPIRIQAVRDLGWAKYVQCIINVSHR